MISTAPQVTAGYGHVCALVSSGQVYCWGDNSVDQIGVGVTGGVYNTPQPVSGISTAIQVSAGSSHTCALLNDNQTIMCWGYTGCGMLGNGTTTNSDVPVQVIGL